jgi:hypothetical protein
MAEAFRVIGEGTASARRRIGTGTDVTIAEPARLIADDVGFTGQFVFDIQSGTEPRVSFSTSPK